MRLTKATVTALMLVLVLVAGLEPAPAREVVRPDCLKFGLCEVVTCNPKGGYTYTFQVTNASAFPATQADFVLVNPPNAVITPNHVVFNPPLLPGQSQQITVTITGAGPGKLCFGLNIHDERKLNCCTETDKCVTLPACGSDYPPQGQGCTEGVCCARAPRYEKKQFGGQKVAAVTGAAANWLPQDYVLTAFDLSGANGFNPNVDNQPPKYNGLPGGEWNWKNLGSIFGVTIDHLGNIYVTATSAYLNDSYPLGAGRIYKISTGTGAISNFNAVPLPNSPDPNFGQTYPALGNISFDCARKQFFVTNLEDGRIYRLNTTGSVASTFDHATGAITNNGNPEAGDQPGFARLGERLWAVQVHDNRVYYSVWSEDFGNRNPNPAVKNEIWSVGLNLTTGDFSPNDKRLELQIPDLPGRDYSNPVSDISFYRDGRVLLAERSMSTATSPYAHESRVLEYTCAPSGWTPAPPQPNLPYKYNVGTAVGAGPHVPSNAAGGIDYDFDPGAVFGVWATGDALQFSPQRIYGLQGFPLAGGDVLNSALIDLGDPDKYQIGDVEVSCPPGGIHY